MRSRLDSIKRLILVGQIGHSSPSQANQRLLRTNGESVRHQHSDRESEVHENFMSTPRPESCSPFPDDRFEWPNRHGSVSAVGGRLGCQWAADQAP